LAATAKREIANDLDGCHTDRHAHVCCQHAKTTAAAAAARMMMRRHCKSLQSTHITRLCFYLLLLLLIYALASLQQQQQQHCLHAYAFDIVSWNILAPVFATPSKYRHTPHKYLDWSYREPRIVDRLLDLDADIVCLQEVQVDVWESMYAQLSGEYGAVEQVVSDDHPVMNVILYRHCMAEVVAVESRSRALIAVMRVRMSVDTRMAMHREVDMPMSVDTDVEGMKEVEDTERLLFVANVHLEARNKEETRVYQLRSLFKRLDHHIQRHCPVQPCVVLAGDFNMIDTHPIYHLLSHGSLPESYGLVMPSRSWLPLLNAYAERPSGMAMTFRGGTMLDYVWYTGGSLEVERTWRTEHGCGDCQSASWPSRYVPSDHVPIGVSMRFRCNESSESEESDKCSESEDGASTESGTMAKQ
jgi:CCR4-NOT transcription complex subunit 6